MIAEPDYEVALNLVKHFTTDELRDLISTDDKIMDLVKSLPQIKNCGMEASKMCERLYLGHLHVTSHSDKKMKNLYSEQELLFASNKSLAEFNLSFEPQLLQGKQNLISKYEEVGKLRDEIVSMKNTLESSQGQYSSDTIQALLQTATQEMEDETEVLWQSYQKQDYSVEDFLKEFINKKKTVHLRKVKAEKIGEIVKNSNTRQSSYPYLSSLMPMPSQPNF